jgi:hypothetical protein
MIFNSSGDPLFPPKPEIELPPQSTPGGPDYGRMPDRPSPGSEPSLPMPQQPGSPEFPRYSAPRGEAYLYRDMNF